MTKNKKFLLVVLLMSVYTVLLCHEVMVNQVLCQKNDGSANLELAILNFQCECRNINDYAHSRHCKLENCNQFSPQTINCCDLILGDSWLKRNITDGTLEPEINFLKQCNLNLQIKRQLGDPFDRLIESIPLSKFLEKIPSQKNNFILLC